MQDFFNGDYMIYENQVGPFSEELVAKMRDFCRRRKVRAQVTPPEKLYVTAYKTVTEKTFAAYADWMLVNNKPSRFDLLQFWSILGWNDRANFCYRVSPFGQVSQKKCFNCMRRSTVVDVHELINRSGLAYGIIGLLLDRTLRTGKKVIDI
jgi:hypothetical protein